MRSSIATLSALTALGSVVAHPHIDPTGLTTSNARSNPEVRIRTVYVNAAETVDVARGITKRATYVETAIELVKTHYPRAAFRVVGDHYVGSNGIAHVNFKQTAHDIDIQNANFHVNVGADGSIFSYGGFFFEGEIPQTNPLVKKDFHDPVTALKGIVSTLNLPIDTTGATTTKLHDREASYKLKVARGTHNDPQAHLVYYAREDNSLTLTWRVDTDLGTDWPIAYANAANHTDIVSVTSHTAHYATYQVYPINLNDPTEGSRSLVTDPWNSVASPFNWHSDGVTSYTTTQGNNVIATYDWDDEADWGDGTPETLPKAQSPTRQFIYSYSPATVDFHSYVNASLTQIFYTVNMFHDLVYLLGFNEAAGNFQHNNNGKGGQGGDEVWITIQTGMWTNNANFNTLPDGQSGSRMNVFMFDRAGASAPKRDPSFDRGIVVHEYTHGVSNRLTGGPANVECLSGEGRGLGEGWSDFLATAVRVKATDTRNTDYVYGAWPEANTAGSRAYPYSTKLSVNPSTLQSVPGSSPDPYAIGTVWATMLYEVLWNLIDLHGNSAAFFPTVGANGIPNNGRHLTMKLVLDGMALQPCLPNFLQARNAIIDADLALTGGQNKCPIWRGFAKRGLGVAAQNTAGSGGSTTRVNDFTVPAGC